MPEFNHCSILRRRYLRSLLKFANFVYICITHGNPTIFISNVVVVLCVIQIIIYKFPQILRAIFLQYILPFSGILS